MAKSRVPTVDQHTAVTIVGDVHVEQFRPGKLRSESVYNDSVSVYRSDEATEKLLTESPGGAAFLALLLNRTSVTAQAIVPIQPSWPLTDRFANDARQSRTPLAVIPLGAPERPNRVESFYARPETSDPWRLHLRVEELHKADKEKRQPKAINVKQSSILVVDDYGRGAITQDVLAKAAKCGADRVVISVQFGKGAKDRYKAVMARGREVIVVCTERQALYWSGLPEVPSRFPLGRPIEQKDLLELVLANIMATFPAASHVIVNLAGPPLVSLWMQRPHNNATVHRVALIEPVAIPPERPRDAVPGSDTFHLAALVAALAHGKPLDNALENAVSAAAAYNNDGVRERDGFFGRLEVLPTTTRRNEVVTSYPILPSPKGPPKSDIDFLRRAQLHGRLLPEELALNDYYAPPQMNARISSLMEALSAYSDKPSKRPFNILLDAAPGSGKSYFAYCLARQLERQTLHGGGPSEQYPLVERNLSLSSGLESIERSLVDLYETVRDHRAIGRIPVVLIDEFDTLAAGKRAPAKGNGDDMDKLLAQMLAPLWDGVFAVDGRLHRLGGFILLLAVSTGEFLARLNRPRGKWKDFVSRLDVRLSLKTSGTSGGEAIKKSNVYVAVAMLRRHFGASVTRVQLAVLDAVANAHFSGQNRSIDQMIMMSSRPVGGIFTTANLPNEDLRARLATNFNRKKSEDRFGESFVEI